MTGTDTIIAGGGFAGIYSAWRLSREGVRVLLIEAAEQLGGSMNSRRWGEYWVDHGAHNLDMRSDRALTFYTDVLGDDLVQLHGHSWASTTGSVWCAGFAMPDYSADDPALCARALNDMRELANRSDTDHDASDAEDISFLKWYEANYGNQLTQAIRPVLGKLTGSNPDIVSAAARDSLRVLLRPKLGDDDDMAALKTASAFWDSRLGVTLSSGHSEFAGANINPRFGYPATHGLGGFCRHAQKRLQAYGVEFKLSTSITSIACNEDQVVVTTNEGRYTAPRLFWSMPEFQLAQMLGIKSDIRESLMPVGFCLYAFEVPVESIAGPDYCNDFSTSRRACRYSRPGIYSQQTTADGYTFIVAEVPAHPSAQSSLLERVPPVVIWQEILQSGYVKPGTVFRSSDQWRFPVAYSLPCLGWPAHQGTLQKALDERVQRIVRTAQGAHARSSFMELFDDNLAQQLT